MFWAKPQEYHDAHTGVSLCFGEHANGGSWIRITVPVANEGEPVRSSTVQLRHGEIVRSDSHPLVGPDAGGDTPADPDVQTVAAAEASPQDPTGTERAKMIDSGEDVGEGPEEDVHPKHRKHKKG